MAVVGKCFYGESHISNITLIDYVLPASGEYSTDYVMLMCANDFEICVHNDNLNLDVDVTYSIDGSDDANKSFVHEVISFPASTTMTVTPLKITKASYVKFKFRGVELQNINCQVEFRGY